MAAEDGFVTEEQRELMEMATLTIENPDTLPTTSSSSSSKGLSTLNGDQHEECGMSGDGEKAPSIGNVPGFTGRSCEFEKNGSESSDGNVSWGELPDTDSEAHFDHNYPIYDSNEEPYKLVGKDVTDPSVDYKSAVASIIEEYFSSGVVEAAAFNLVHLGSREYHPYFIKTLVSVAIARHDREKEMASLLLLALSVNVISRAQISQGFILLLESVEELSADNPDAVNVLALFLSLAIVDDILPLAFPTRVHEILPKSSEGLQAIQVAVSRYLSTPDHAENLERKWGARTPLTVKEMKNGDMLIDDLLGKYVENGDTVENYRFIGELGVSFYHHELVKKAVILSMENRSAEPLIKKLLKETSEEGIISTNQMIKGFYRVEESLDDLSLDIPLARPMFEALIHRAISEGWLHRSFLKSTTEDDVASRQDKLKRYKEEVVSIIHEYFLSNDISELFQSLVDLGAPELNPIFLKRLISVAMDRKNREKEMASVVFSALHIDLFSTEDIVKAFVLLLESAEDTSLDILDASNELALFLARAVIDDVLTPLNLDEIASKLPSNCGGIETVQMARSLVFSRNAGERILRCWGGGRGLAIEDAKEKIRTLLEEYESGGVVGEACQCIRDLGMPFFNHEVVKKALIMAMEKKNDRMLNLLQECFTVGLITINQMTKGFGRVKDDLDDLALDIPNAKDKFQSYMENARNRGWILPSIDICVETSSTVAVSV
ncbi:hypothetical protein vseg_013532 [Gypsophila vaccaria]